MDPLAKMSAQYYMDNNLVSISQVYSHLNNLCETDFSSHNCFDCAFYAREPGNPFSHVCGAHYYEPSATFDSDFKGLIFVAKAKRNTTNERN